MPQETVNHGMHWEAGREELNAPIGFNPVIKDAGKPYFIPCPPATFGSVIDSPQPEVDWSTWEEREKEDEGGHPNYLGKLWGSYTRLWWDRWDGRSLEA